VRTISLAFAVCCLMATPVLPQESSVPDIATISKSARMDERVRHKAGGRAHRQIWQAGATANPAGTSSDVRVLARAKMAVPPRLRSFVAPISPAIQRRSMPCSSRYERLLEQLSGHMHEINREFRQQADLDLGPMLPL